MTPTLTETSRRQVRVNRRVGLCLGYLVAVLLLRAVAAEAHTEPYSYVDLAADGDRLTAVVTVHVVDAGHELGLAEEQALAKPDALVARSSDVAAVLEQRLSVSADGERLTGLWSQATALRERNVLRFEVVYRLAAPPGVIRVAADMFPYDPTHRTFLNLYEHGELAAQEIFGETGRDTEYFTGTRQGGAAVVRRFLPAGVHHILVGPDHVLFLVGLLLAGGTLRRLLVIVTAFTLAHSVTLSLSALSIVMPPAWLIEPAIALSIVYVGLDNLLRGQGRDVRVWIAFGFGLIHGFGFAYLLREMGLPPRALAVSLFSFNAGVEIGQVLVVMGVGALLYWLRTRYATLNARVVTVGSIAVIVAGAYWFVERTFL